MITIPFWSEFDERTNRQISNRNAINMYPEKFADTYIMRQRYGLLLNQAVNVGPYRGGIVANGLMFFVNNNTFYKMDINEVVTAIGTLATFSGHVSMDSNGYELMVVDGTDGYAYEFATATFTKITDLDFTGILATQVRFLDGYFVAFKPGTGEFYKTISYPTHAELTTSGAGWEALDFDVAQSSPDDILAMEVIHQQLVFFGEDTTEFWVNTANTEFPFERQPGGIIEWGIQAPNSVAKGDSTIVFLAKNKEGYGHVVQVNGFDPKVISTDAIEELIASNTSTDAYAFVFKEGKHLFYSLTLPTHNRTVVYDFTTGKWHERQSFGVGRWRVSMHISYNSKQYVGDALNGNLYTLSSSTYVDDTTSMVRTVRTSHQSENQDKLTCHEIQLLCEQGVGLISGQGSDPVLALRWSDNRGKTWSNSHTLKLGAIGEYDHRTRKTNCGSYYNRTWEASVSDPVPWVLIGAFGRYSTIDVHTDSK